MVSLEKVISNIPNTIKSVVGFSDVVLGPQLQNVDGFDFQCNATFVLYKNEAARQKISDYVKFFIEESIRQNAAFHMTKVDTWRASHDWAQKLGMSDKELVETTRLAVRLHKDIKRQLQASYHHDKVIVHTN